MLIASRWPGPRLPPRAIASKGAGSTGVRCTVPGATAPASRCYRCRDRRAPIAPRRVGQPSRSLPSPVVEKMLVGDENCRRERSEVAESGDREIWIENEVRRSPVFFRGRDQGRLLPKESWEIRRDDLSDGERIQFVDGLDV